MKHEEREVRQIYNDYSDDLYRLCYFYTGNVHDAMDAVQNTLVHLMEYTGTFESESHGYLRLGLMNAGSFIANGGDVR